MIPYTDHECRLKLDEIQRGDCVVIPQSIEHAQFMIQVAQSYINQRHNETIELLKKDHV